jgi:hypothetical protein
MSQVRAPRLPPVGTERQSGFATTHPFPPGQIAGSRQLERGLFKAIFCSHPPEAALPRGVSVLYPFRAWASTAELRLSLGLVKLPDSRQGVARLKKIGGRWVK